MSPTNMQLYELTVSELYKARWHPDRQSRAFCQFQLQAIIIVLENQPKEMLKIHKNITNVQHYKMLGNTSENIQVSCLNMKS